MLDTLKTLLTNQFEASLSTLNLAITKCPDENWHQPVVNWKFCQAAFHAVFFTDVYLQPSDDIPAFKAQPFHLAHVNDFRTYEEFGDVDQVLLYEKTFILEYMQYARKKAQQVIASESAEVLQAASGFRRRLCTRAELHVYNIRHIQHHAAQLSLRLRLVSGIDIPWVSHAWKEA